MPGQYDLPKVKQPSQPTGGPRPPSAPKPPTGLALEPEFHQVYSLWNKEQSPEANDAMLKNLNPIIDNAVKTYAGSGNNSVLKSRAKKIVIDSLPNYDPTNTKLKTYVFNQLQGLKRFSLHQNQVINIPEQVQLDYVNLKRKEDELQDNLGRPPSDEELADATSLSKKRIGYVRKLRLPSSEGTVLQPLMNSDSADFNDPSVVNRPSRGDMSAWHSFVYDSLGDIDKVIMEHSFGLNGKSVLSNQQIAQKLRVSPAAISLRKNKIQQELDKREQLRVL
jgi:DNA-directed RNA polymerase specialized sigma subunit